MTDRYEGSFFGRRKGKPLSPRREALMETRIAASRRWT